MKTVTRAQLNREFIYWPVYMRRALELAANVLSATPNPRVGCVLVKLGRIVGEGWHAAAGRDHAEVHALRQAGDEAREAIAFVTLEPCVHQGRTGPCTRALIEAGVSRVAIAGLDPNPAVSGRGVAELEAAGIPVVHLTDFDAPARRLNRGYFKRRETGLPFVTVKLAMSLDGRTALASGQSKWITSSAARADVQRLRAASSAVLTGIGTVLADDPALTVRPDELSLDAQALALNSATLESPRLRVLLDSQLQTPGTANVLSGPGDTLIYTMAALAQQAGKIGRAQIKGVDGSAGRVNLHSVLKSLAAEHECNDVLVEAGATLSGAFVQAGLVDELVLYMAPTLLGSDARPLLNLTGLTALDQAPRFRVRELSVVGDDAKLILTPEG